MLQVNKLWAALLVGVTLTACQTTGATTEDKTAKITKVESVLLMPVDVELSTLTAGGMTEPNAAWTEKALENIQINLGNIFGQKKTSLVKFPTGVEDQKLVQLRKLHNAVGLSILRHDYMPALSLPSKNGKMDWTLGPSAKELKQRYGTDYALFVFLRDSYASGGRVAAIMVASLFGVGLHGGVQLGFASLVDLNSGEIVWFNRLARGTGDLRTVEDSRNSIDVLLDGFPG